MPVDYTRLDGIIDIMFTAATDVAEGEGETPASEDTDEPVVVAAGTRSSMEAIEKKRGELITMMSARLGAQLVKKSRATFWDVSAPEAVVALRIETLPHLNSSLLVRLFEPPEIVGLPSNRWTTVQSGRRLMMSIRSSWQRWTRRTTRRTSKSTSSLPRKSVSASTLPLRPALPTANLTRMVMECGSRWTLTSRGIATSVGSGIAEKYPRVAMYSIEALLSDGAEQSQEAEGGLPAGDEAEPPARLTTIAEVMAWARERVAEIAGVRVEAVKLDLKMEY